MSEKMLVPLSEASPCGIDFKYEDTFLAIEAEIDKSNSMLEDVSTDWGLVLNDTYNLLSESTKDTKIYSWWVYASWKKEGAVGLQKALSLFSEVLGTYADKLFPKSKKVKLSSLLWLEERLNEELLDERGVITSSFDTKAFLETLTTLEKNFALTIKEEISVFSKIKTSLQREVTEMQAKEKKAEIAVQMAQTPSSAENKIDEITSDSEAKQVLKSLKKEALLLQKYYMGLDSFDVRSIRLVRMAAWLEIDELPMDTDGKTPLRPPSELSINEIEDFLEEEEFEKALQALETLLSLSPFWLEGHFKAFNILTQLEQPKAANEVKNALITFVKANERVLELNFQDNTPFASIKLKQWLAESSSEVSVSKDDLDIVDAKAQTIENAHALAKKKKMKEAMGLLQEQSVLAINKEDRFHWRLAKAELAVEFGKKEVALALLDELMIDIDRYHLDEWQPQLSGRVFSLYLNTFDRTTVDLKDLNTAYARLCKVDIAQALETTI